MQTIQIPSPIPAASGFNPTGLNAEQVGEKHGWRLLNEGDAIKKGDGYWNETLATWIDYACRPDIFRPEATICEGRACVHTWAWRRKCAL